MNSRTTKTFIVLAVAGALFVAILGVRTIARQNQKRGVSTAPRVATEVQTASRSSRGPGSTRAVHSRSVSTMPPQTGIDQRTSATVAAEPIPPSDELATESLAMMALRLRENPSDIRLLLGELAKEKDPEKLMVLMQLIDSNTDIDEFPLEDLVKLTTSGDANQRYAALMLMAKSERVTPDMLKAVASLSQNDSEIMIRERAITTMDQWMPKNTKIVGEVCNALIQTRDASNEPTIRGYAMQTISNAPDGVPDSVVEALGASLTGEPVAQNRAMAACALSRVQASSRPVALEKLQSAYNSEVDLDVKRQIINLIMRAGGADAVDILKRLPASDPLLVQDVRDYVEIVQGGATERDDILEAKGLLDTQRGTEPDKH